MVKILAIGKGTQDVFLRSDEFDPHTRGKKVYTKSRPRNRVGAPHLLLQLDDSVYQCLGLKVLIEQMREQVQNLV